MGHVGIKGLHHAVHGISCDDSTRESCSICARANIRCTPFPSHSNRHASRALERVHCDVAGPLLYCYRNYSYYIVFVDCYTRFISLFFIKSCDEACNFLIEFQTATENFTGQRLTILQVDNAPELTRGKMEEHCKTHGISFEKTIPGSPPQNGVAERTNLTITSMVRAMLIDGDLSDFFWPFATQAAVHIKNHLPHSALPPDKTPFKLWHRYKPNLSHLRLFSAPCTSHILSNNLSKFHPRGETACFLGYAKDVKGYLLWIPGPNGQRGSVKSWRDVIFHNTPPIQTVPPLNQELAPLWEDTPFPEHLMLYVLTTSVNIHLCNLYRSTNNPDINPPSPKQETTEAVPVNQPAASEWCVPIIPVTSKPYPSHNYYPLYSLPRRPVHAPLKYRNYVHSDTIVDQLLQQDNQEIAIQLSRTPNSLSDAFTQFQQNDTIMFSISDEEAKDPESVPEAQKSVYWNKWLIAMHDKLESLKAKETYELVDSIPPGRKAVQCKWVLHIKHDKNNSIAQFKACLVTKGFTQIPGQDFTYTFAPVARWDSIRALLAITALNDFELRQLNVKTAYLNSPLEEEIYMRAPPGSGSPYWCLRKGLYGLR